MTITEELEKLIDKRASEKVNEIKGNIQQYIDWVDGLDETLTDIVSGAKDVLAEFKEENLSVNAIEAEGFLRAAITIKSQIDEDKKWL